MAEDSGLAPATEDLLRIRIETAVQALRRLRPPEYGDAQYVAQHQQSSPQVVNTEQKATPNTTAGGATGYVVILRVAMDHGKCDLEVPAGADPAVLAREFCAQHRLSDEQVSELEQHIRENMALVDAGTPRESTVESGWVTPSVQPAGGNGVDSSFYNTAYGSKTIGQQQGGQARGGLQAWTEDLGVTPIPGPTGVPNSIGGPGTSLYGASQAAPQAHPPRSQSVRDDPSLLLLHTLPSKQEAREMARAARQMSAQNEAHAQEASTVARRQKYQDPNETFRPKINPRSRRMARRTLGNLDKNATFERLHNDYKSRMAVLDALRDQFEARRVADELGVPVHAAKDEAGDRVPTLNSHSQELVSNRQVAPVSVRLYADARMKQKKLEERRRMLQEREEVEASEDPELTFKPRISKMAQNMVREGRLVHERITDPQGEAKRRRMAQVAEEKEAAQEASASFKPRLNKRTKQLVGNRQGGNVSDRLYKEYLQRRRKQRDLKEKYQEQANEVFNHQPRVNTRRGLSRRRGDFFDRQEADTQRWLQRRRAANDAGGHTRDPRSAKEANSGYYVTDPRTGQPVWRDYFKPKITRGPKDYDRNRLYQAHRHRSREGAHRPAPEDRPAPVSNASDQLLSEMKLRRFVQVFDVLDQPDGDGYIDETCAAQFHKLSEGEQVFVVPLLERITQYFQQQREQEQQAGQDRDGQTGGDGEGKQGSDGKTNGEGSSGDAQPLWRLSFTQFAHVMNEELKRLSEMGPTTGQFLRAERSRDVDQKKLQERARQDHTFKPRISKRSEMLARRQRMVSTSASGSGTPDGTPQQADLYEYLHRDAHVRQARLESTVQRKMHSEMENLSFQPQISQPPSGTAQAPPSASPGFLSPSVSSQAKRREKFVKVQDLEEEEEV